MVCFPSATVDGYVSNPDAFQNENLYIGVNNTSGGITYTTINSINIQCASDGSGDIIITIDPPVDLNSLQQ